MIFLDIFSVWDGIRQINHIRPTPVLAGEDNYVIKFVGVHSPFSSSLIYFKHDTQTPIIH
jgi:hypothetical protein